MEKLEARAIVVTPQEKMNAAVAQMWECDFFDQDKMTV